MVCVIIMKKKKQSKDSFTQKDMEALYAAILPEAKMIFQKVYDSLEEDTKNLSDPDKAMYYQNVAIHAKRAEEFDKAIELYKRSLYINPTNPMLYYNLGKLFFLNKEYLNAVKSYLNATRNGLNPDINLIRHLGFAFLAYHMEIYPEKFSKDYLFGAYTQSLLGRPSISEIPDVVSKLSWQAGIDIYGHYKNKKIFFSKKELEENKKLIDTYNKEKIEYMILKEKEMIVYNGN